MLNVMQCVWLSTDSKSIENSITYSAPLNLLVAFHSRDIGEPLAGSIIQNTEKVATEGHMARFCWVLSHFGIEGIQRADSYLFTLKTSQVLQRVGTWVERKKKFQDANEVKEKQSTHIQRTQCRALRKNSRYHIKKTWLGCAHRKCFFASLNAIGSAGSHVVEVYSSLGRIKGSL